MHRVLLLIKMLVVSVGLVFIGAVILALPIDASPIWPLDGILAVLGGIGLGCLAIPFWRETREEGPEPEPGPQRGSDARISGE